MADIFRTDGNTEGDGLDALASEADRQAGTILEQARIAAAASNANPPWHDPSMQVVVYGAPTDWRQGPERWPAQPVPFVPGVASPGVPVDAPPPYADAEVAALAAISAALQALDPEARKRLLRYLAARYGA